jgi:peptidoglycan L-alanyl-D-glutamate endopeptidase CwlK
MNEHSLERLKKVDYSLVSVIVEAEKTSPIRFEITQGYRTIEEQQELYKKGRVYPGLKVTDCDGVKKRSKHNFFPSRAVDVVCYIDNKVTWNRSVYKKLSEHILSVALKMNIPVKWGGSFKNFDGPHYQI